MTQVTARPSNSSGERVAPLGSATKEHRRVLLTLADALRPLLGDDPLRTLDSTIEALDAKAVRIAVTGRANSGFPRIANAIAGRPHLLPATAPPKTATVARMTFCEEEGKRSGALFQFFDAPAWEAIISGGGRLRRKLDTKATAALVSRLDREVEEMRTRAYMRLGEEYHKVLGTEHRIEELTSPVAARYLGAQEEVDGSRTARARFADITREAQLFLPIIPFADEASLVVTPGFDADFVVREERTAMALEESDVCIAVISADEPVNAQTREMLSLLLDAVGDRLVVLLDRDPDSDARVDRVVLQEVVSDFCAERLEGTRIPVVLCSSIEAERGLMAQSGATHGDPNTLLANANLAGIVRAVEEALFWGPGLTANEAAADTFQRLAEHELESLARKIAIINDRRERIRLGTHDVKLEQAQRDDARARLIKAATTAKGRIEDHLSVLWGQWRTEALRSLRSLAEDVASGTVTGAGASPKMRNARNPLAIVLTAYFHDSMKRHASELSGVLDVERQQFHELLAHADVTEDVPVSLQVPVEIQLDQDALLVPIEEASVREPQASSFVGRGGDYQRQLMIPYQAVVEKVTEDATLVLGKAVREKVAMLSDDALHRMEQQADAASRANELSSLISRHSQLEAVVGQLSVFRSATARGQEPLSQSG